MSVRTHTTEGESSSGSSISWLVLFWQFLFGICIAAALYFEHIFKLFG